MKKLLPIFAFAAIALAGCAGYPLFGPQEYSAPLPPPPTADTVLPYKLGKNWKDVVIMWSKKSMDFKDPESAQFNFEKEPVPCLVIARPRTAYSDISKGYCGLVDINAKNGFGGYTGAEPYFYFYANNGMGDKSSKFTKDGVAMVFPFEDAAKMVVVTPPFTSMVGLGE